MAENISITQTETSVYLMMFSTTNQARNLWPKQQVFHAMKNKLSESWRSKKHLPPCSVTWTDHLTSPTTNSDTNNNNNKNNNNFNSTILQYAASS